MKKLTQLGHFGDREYDESAKGIRALENLANELKKRIGFLVNSFLYL